MILDGQTIKRLGYKPSKWWKNAIDDAKNVDFVSDETMIRFLDGYANVKLADIQNFPLRKFGVDAMPLYYVNIEAENEGERDNIAAVERHMDELMRLPTVVGGAVMPDACPSGSQLGTIPVGGVIATKGAIHPGMHSADICCSMAVTIFSRDADPTKILDAGMVLSHFGGGGRDRGKQLPLPDHLIERYESNALLKPRLSMAREHFGTQGDGNHFFYVGRVQSTGNVALVTHHGSRGPGAMLYKQGMAIAEDYRKLLSPETPAHNAWIPENTKEFDLYWDALQVTREWTKQSHFALHDLIVEATGTSSTYRFWNEHNFVFRKSDGLIYHAKGATPSFDGFGHDDSGLTLIPLNMAQPILIAKHANSENGLGFAPHGAGRNMSRTAYMRENAHLTVEQMIAEQAPGIDVRHFSGVPDASELPGAYKNADQVWQQIEKFGLANVVDQIDPIGNIMAGDWQVNAPWRKKRDAKQAAKLAGEIS